MGPEDLAKLGAAGVAAYSLMTAGAVPKMHERKRSASLVRLEPGLKDDPAFPGLRFQYYPASISDTKAVTYSQKAVPGGSLPLYQWINGGERVISFTAMFSSDIDLSLTSDAVGAGSLVDEVKANGVEDRNVDVRAALVWLRSFMLPMYLPSGTLPPPKAILQLPGTGIGLMGGAVNGQTEAMNDSVVCVMNQCDVEIKASFPSGTIRLAAVQLGFAQVPQRGGVVAFPGWYEDSIMEEAYTEGVGDTGGYNLRPK
jgi:hypothetical protein